MSQIIKDALVLVKEQRYYDSVQALMGWDHWAGLSKEGQPYRSELSGFITRKSFAQLKSRETGLLIEGLKELEPSAFSDVYEQGAVRSLIERYTRAFQVPEDLQIELRNHTAQAQAAWQEAWKLNSFDYYKPWIEKLFDIKLRIANAINPNCNPFDVLCDTVDRGIDTREVGRIFAALKVGISDILVQIKDEQGKIDVSPLDVPFTKQQIRDMAAEINALSGYDYNKGRDSETVHGMCTGVGPRDSRIAISLRSPWNTIFVMLHEGGHGRYNYSSCDRAVECGVWGGVSGAMHESVARFYENMVGRSPQFINLAYPIITKHFPEMANVSPTDFYRMVNRVEPNLVRLGADELTYSLHPIIRFEMEKDFFDKKVKTADFEELWNAKYKECFGLTPKNVKEGVLQDIHWASGHIGYFQSYTLGNIYGGQFLNSILKATPDTYSKIAEGNFNPINNWFKENIFRHGNSAYTPTELLVNATGEKLNEKYFLDYLRQKFLGK